MLDALRQHYSKVFYNYRWLLHFLFWFLFSLVVFDQFERSGGLFSSKQNSYSALYKLSYVLIMIVQAYGIIGIIKLNSERSKLVFWTAFILWFLFCYTLATTLIYHAVLSNPAIASKPNKDFLSLFENSFTSHLFASSIFIAFYYFVDIHDQQKQIQRLGDFKAQKIALESSFLKSQVNPHFLFNTLNNIYALSLKKSVQTPVIIDRLEALLHYMLYECKVDRVSLDDEFKFTTSYLELEKLRHNEDHCKVTVKITGDTHGRVIAPLLLINFLENAFKHGTKTSFGKSWINMEIETTAETIHFKLQNSKPQKPANAVRSEYTGGIGLVNVRRRLEILYPRRHTLTINNLPEHFEVNLTIRF